MHFTCPKVEIITSLSNLFSKVLCPAYLHASKMLRCQWSGFLDPESTISSFTFMIGSDENRDDIFKSENIPTYAPSYDVKGNITISLIDKYFIYTLQRKNNKLGSNGEFLKLHTQDPHVDSKLYL